MVNFEKLRNFKKWIFTVEFSIFSVLGAVDKIIVQKMGVLSSAPRRRLIAGSRNC